MFWDHVSLLLYVGQRVEHVNAVLTLSGFDQIDCAPLIHDIARMHIRLVASVSL